MRLKSEYWGILLSFIMKSKVLFSFYSSSSLVLLFSGQSVWWCVLFVTLQAKKWTLNQGSCSEADVCVPLFMYLYTCMSTNMYLWRLRLSLFTSVTLCLHMQIGYVNPVRYQDFIHVRHQASIPWYLFNLKLVFLKKKKKESCSLTSSWAHTQDTFKNMSWKCLERF